MRVDGCICLEQCAGAPLVTALAREHQGRAPAARGALNRCSTRKQRAQRLEEAGRRRAARRLAERLLALQRRERRFVATHRRQHRGLVHCVARTIHRADRQPVNRAKAAFARLDLREDALLVGGHTRLRLAHVDAVAEVVDHPAVGHEAAVVARGADEHHHGLASLERRAQLDEALLQGERQARQLAAPGDPRGTADWGSTQGIRGGGDGVRVRCGAPTRGRRRTWTWR